MECRTFHVTANTLVTLLCFGKMGGLRQSLGQWAIIGGAVLLLSAAALLPGVRWEGLNTPLHLCLAALSFAVVLLAIRFRTLRLVLASSNFFAASVTLQLLPVTPDAIAWTATLIAVNLSFLATVDESHVDWEISAWWLAWLLLETVVLAGIEHFEPQKLASSALASVGSLTVTVTAAISGLATAFLALMSLIRRDPGLGGMFWACVPMLGIAVLRPASTTPWLLIVAAVALGVSLIERSYWIAYFDELTGLRGRRALNETFNSLGVHYCIAVVDVDHFKSFNDTYGHDIGDQVLRKVASQLARVTGGGQAFRCGGEEFVVVFKNKSAQQALVHAEKLRQAIEDDVFYVRGPDRSKRERTERRRTNKTRPRSEACTVTVSIGLAEAPEDFSAQQVYKAADRALYRAKNNGRNRVEVARRRGSTASVELAADKA